MQVSEIISLPIELKWKNFYFYIPLQKQHLNKKQISYCRRDILDCNIRENLPNINRISYSCTISVCFRVCVIDRFVDALIRSC